MKIAGFHQGEVTAAIMVDKNKAFLSFGKLNFFLANTVKII